MRASEIITETKRKSAAVKLQGAWERQQAKSTASRKRGEEYMAKIKQDVADKAKKEKDVEEGWSQKYKSSINCSHPKGFSQKAHCAGKKKHNEDMSMEMVCPECGMCETHGNVMEIKKGAKDSNGYSSCWKGYHAAGTKKGKNGGQVRNCVPDEDVEEDWQKVNKHDDTDGMSRKAVSAYRRENPGSKLKTAVTTKPSKLKKGSKSAKRRASFCARMSGMKKHNAGAKTKRDPDSPINKALRRWNCESIEEMQELIMLGEQYISNMKEGGEKYKIKSVGAEGGKDYYISPSTGKKVYKKAKVGDHENPNSGEHKPKVRMPYKEDGSAGGTSSGSIASVSMPLGGKKKKKGAGVNLLGGPVFKR